MKQNKQKALERLREIEIEIIRKSEFLTEDKKSGIGNVIQNDGINNLKKEAQKIKDDWEDGCGEEYKGVYCGSKYCFIGIKITTWFCPTCSRQNKEEKEICGRILG